MLRTKSPKVQKPRATKTSKKVVQKKVKKVQRRSFATGATQAAAPGAAKEFKDLWVASQLGDVLTVKECLEQAEPKIDVNAYNSYKQTPLILAIKNRHVKTVQLLVKNGADINKPCGQGIPPFFHAIKKNSVSLFRAVTALEPDTHRVLKGNISPLTYAAMNKVQPTILEDLRLMGFNVDHRDDTGSTPLMYAVLDSPLKSVEWFLNEGASTTTRNKDGKSVVARCMANHDKRVGKLVKQRAQEAVKLNGGQIQAEDKEVKAALQKIIDATIAQQKAMNPPKAQVKQ